MRINDDVLKCVCFLGVVLHEEPHRIDGDLFGTAFFVSVPVESGGGKFVYLVTAKHNLEPFLGTGEAIYAMVNSTDGGVKAVKFPADAKWWFHPDPAVDLAVLDVVLHDYMAVTTLDMLDLCLTPKSISRYQIGPGDEVFIIGLFAFAPGESRAVPIVRHGNLAMLPNEQLMLKGNVSADVYLIEARSIGGLSGSPVFVRETVRIDLHENATGDKVQLHGAGRIQLLGVAYGHWDVDEGKKNSYQIEADSEGGVNMGIAIVTPAIKLLEILNTPELVERRKLAEEEMRKKMMPSPDSVAVKGKTPHDRFQDLASKVVTVSKEEIDKREAKFRKEQTDNKK